MIFVRNLKKRNQSRDSHGAVILLRICQFIPLDNFRGSDGTSLLREFPDKKQKFPLFSPISGVSSWVALTAHI
jgi:hypothetical protein